MKTTLAISVGLLVFGCSFFRGPTFWDTINAVCESSLVNTSEVQAKAVALKLTPAEVAGALCKIADVIEPFVREEMAAKQGEKAGATGNPTAQAVAIAKSKGLL
jgi:hypothetical protein